MIEKKHTTHLLNFYRKVNTARCLLMRHFQGCNLVFMSLLHTFDRQQQLVSLKFQLGDLRFEISHFPVVIRHVEATSLVDLQNVRFQLAQLRLHKRSFALELALRGVKLILVLLN